MTQTLPKLVSMTAPDEAVMDPHKAVVPLPPFIVTAPLLLLSSPNAQVKLPLPSVADDRSTIKAAPTAAPKEIASLDPECTSSTVARAH